MKKSLSVILALILSLALSACTETAGGPVSRSANGIYPEKIYEAEANAPSETAADVMINENKKSDLISRQHAIKLSLEAVQLKRIDVRDVDAEIERERNTTFWEVNFETRNYEYSFLIDAFDGTIVRNNLEFND